MKYYDYGTMVAKVGTRGEPFDIAYNGWFVDWADPANFFEPPLDPDCVTTGNSNFSYYTNTRMTARIDAANRLSGDARRKAWADLDADLMRNDPPWAPFIHSTNAYFVSRSYGCFLVHPVYGVDLAAACKKK